MYQCVSSEPYFETLGIITNNTANTVSYVNAIASLYIGNGLIVGCDFGYINTDPDPPHLAPGQQSSFDTLTWLPDPYAVTRYKLQADGSIYSQNSLDEMNGERLRAFGENKTMRLMDWSTLFQIGPEK